MPTHGHRVDVDIAMDVDIIDFDIAVSFQSPARVTHTHTHTHTSVVSCVSLVWTWPPIPTAQRGIFIHEQRGVEDSLLTD